MDKHGARHRWRRGVAFPCRPVCIQFCGMCHCVCIHLWGHVVYTSREVLGNIDDPTLIQVSNSTDD